MQNMTLIPFDSTIDVVETGVLVDGCVELKRVTTVETVLVVVVS